MSGLRIRAYQKRQGPYKFPYQGLEYEPTKKGGFGSRRYSPRNITFARTRYRGSGLGVQCLGLRVEGLGFLNPKP